MEDSYLPIRTLLIVEDEPQLLAILKEEIQRLGYQVITATNGNEALNMLDLHKIHAVLSDILMPEMSGVDLLAVVRSRGFILPFVFITGSQTEENLLSAVRLGAVDFIKKPFSFEELIRTVDRSLEIGIKIENCNLRINEIKNEVPNSAKKLDEHQSDQRRILLLQAIGNKNRS